MKFIADLHVHSKFSRATAKNLDLENLYIAAQMKGVTVVATGDFTHPQWFSEICEKLLPAEDGLFALKPDIAKVCDEGVPPACRAPVRFMLETEISNIYKKNERTRKNHNLVFMPDLDTARQFNSRLDAIGNITSDGRPILGLDARDLLEIVLQTSERGYLVPAHIWTPWFSVLGSKSGFDSIEECFEDLTPHVFALETGLSSDPAMNWRVSQLDGYTLISNSDAHSPMIIGRNANLLDTELSFPAIKAAMQCQAPDRFPATFDLYPQEGKYHMDGHRKCSVCSRPEETIKRGGICPVCGKPMTLGVLYRVEELADRPKGKKPENAHPYTSIIPLPEILSEIFRVGPKSKKVQGYYKTTLETLGPELAILHRLPVEEIQKAGIPLLAEAITRMRKNKVFISPGYDGEYGVIRVFTEEEIESRFGQKSLFVLPTSESVPEKKPPLDKDEKPIESPLPLKKPDTIIRGHSSQDKKKTQDMPNLNKEQQKAVLYGDGPLLIVAGPGAGKTRTLTHRIAHLLENRGFSPDNILAVTFTNKAAQEMRNRLDRLVSATASIPLVATFHSLCVHILKEQNIWKEHVIINDLDWKALVRDAVKLVRKSGTSIHLKPRQISEMIISAKQQVLSPSEIQSNQQFLQSFAAEADGIAFAAIYEAVQEMLSTQGLFAYEDLIFHVVRLLESDVEIRKTYQNRFTHIFVDEYQDLNQGQYRIVRALAPPQNNICVIGDPDQSIYGFRGSDITYFSGFVNDFPETEVITLTRNYRSTETILEAAVQIITPHSPIGSRSRIYSDIHGTKTIGIFEHPTEKAEAVGIGKIIERMVGGLGFDAMDSGKIDGYSTADDRGFSDFAVLFRTNHQGHVIADILENARIPCQMADRDNAFCRKGIPELLSMLKIVTGTGSFMDLERILTITDNPMNPGTLELFKTWCFTTDRAMRNALDIADRLSIDGMNQRQHRHVHNFLDHLIRQRQNINTLTVEKTVRYLAENTTIFRLIEESQKTVDAYNRLVVMAGDFGFDVGAFLETIALQTDTDTYEFQVEKVALMTMHAAKGLEFPVVFITGCEDDLIPFRKADGGETDIDEERRLFYVAMTRAKERLFFTWAKKRRIYGTAIARELSPFVRDIENRLLKHERSSTGWAQRQLPVQKRLF